MSTGSMRLGETEENEEKVDAMVDYTPGTDHCRRTDSDTRPTDLRDCDAGDSSETTGVGGITRDAFVARSNTIDPERSANTPMHTGNGENSGDPKDVTWLEIFLTSISSALYLGDVGSDLYVAFLHLLDGHLWWFSLTLAFGLVPSVIMTGFSLAWYYQDHMKQKKSNKRNERTTSHVIRLFRFLFHLLQLGLFVRYIKAVLVSEWSFTTR